MDEINHPLRSEIELLRDIIVSADARLAENFKWNGPNYSLENADRITMKIQPPKCIQLILHCGAKKQKEPEKRIIEGDSDLLDWKTNDRAVITLLTKEEILLKKSAVILILKEWLAKTNQ